MLFAHCTFNRSAGSKLYQEKEHLNRQEHFHLEKYYYYHYYFYYYHHHHDYYCYFYNDYCYYYYYCNFSKILNNSPHLHRQIW